MPCFLMVQAYQRSGFLGVWFVRIQVLRWGQVFQFSDFLRFGVSGFCVYRVLGLQGSGMLGVRFFRGQYFQSSGFFRGQVRFSGVRFLWGKFFVGSGMISF